VRFVMPWGPSPEYADWWYVFSWKGILWSLVATALAALAAVIFTLIQFWSDSIRESRSSERQATLEAQTSDAQRTTALARERIAELEKETALANERAAADRLALAELRSPRTIDTEVFKKALIGKDSATVELLYVDGCSDCFWLATWIFNSLGQIGGLGWPVLPIQQVRSPTTGPLAMLPGPIAAHANPWGITVVARGWDGDEGAPSSFSHDWNDNSPASTLRRAIEASVGKTQGVAGNIDGSLPPRTIRVVVAPKA
jgi:hypothetical protein